MVSGRVMSVEQALDGAFDVLIIDDICSFLSAHLVAELKQRGRGVVGVFEPEDGPDAKRRLLEVGISDVIEANAEASEFIALAATAQPSFSGAHPEPEARSAGGFCVAVAGPPGGVGVTEISVALARELSLVDSSILVDLNQDWPAVAQRLDQPVHPNLRTAADLALHEPGRLEDSYHRAGDLMVVGGLANPANGLLPVSDMSVLVSRVRSTQAFVVLDCGSTAALQHPSLNKHVNAVLLVGLGDPIGLTRLIKFGDSVSGAVEGSGVAVAVNRTPGRSSNGEAAALIKRELGAVPVMFIPDDKRVRRAAWDGGFVTAGRFRRKVKALAAALVGAVSR